MQALIQLAEDYEVDGAIHFSTPACRHENGSFSLISTALRDKGIPVLSLEGDMTDERNSSAELTSSKLTSFLEMLEGRKTH